MRRKNIADQQEVLALGRKVLTTEAEALLQSASLLDLSFHNAVELLVSCKGRVCTTGIGKAGLIAQKVQATLSSTGTPAYHLDPLGAFHGDLGMVQAEDVVLAFSKTAAPEIGKLLSLIGTIGSPIILVTANPKSRTAGNANVVIQIAETAEACPLGLAPSSSTTAMLGIGDALALTVMSVKQISRDDYALRHPGGSLGRALMSVKDIMRTGAACPTVFQHATLHDCYLAVQTATARAGAVLVVDDHNKLEGIITHGDIFRFLLAPGRSSASLVKEAMTCNPITVVDSEPVASAFELMKSRQIDDLPVVYPDGTLAGILDVQDLLALGF